MSNNLDFDSSISGLVRKIKREVYYYLLEYVIKKNQKLADVIVKDVKAMIYEYMLQFRFIGEKYWTSLTNFQKFEKKKEVFTEKLFRNLVYVIENLFENGTEKYNQEEAKESIDARIKSQNVCDMFLFDIEMHLSRNEKEVGNPIDIEIKLILLGYCRELESICLKYFGSMMNDLEGVLFTKFEKFERLFEELPKEKKGLADKLQAVKKSIG